MSKRKPVEEPTPAPAPPPPPAPVPVPVVEAPPPAPPAEPPAIPAALQAPALLTMVRDAIDAGLRVMALPPVQAQAVVIPMDMDSKPYLIESESVEALAAELRKLHGADVQVFAFSGQRLLITKPPRFLVASDNRYPLFGSKDEIVPDRDGYMGDQPTAG